MDPQFLKLIYSNSKYSSLPIILEHARKLTFAQTPDYDMLEKAIDWDMQLLAPQDFTPSLQQMESQRFSSELDLSVLKGLSRPFISIDSQSRFNQSRYVSNISRFQGASEEVAVKQDEVDENINVAFQIEMIYNAYDKHSNNLKSKPETGKTTSVIK